MEIQVLDHHYFLISFHDKPNHSILYKNQQDGYTTCSLKDSPKPHLSQVFKNHDTNHKQS